MINLSPINYTLWYDDIGDDMRKIKKLSRRGSITISSLLILLITSGIGVWLFSKDDLSEYKTYDKNNKDYGEVEHFEEDENGYLESYFYPTTKHKEIDKSINTYIEKLKKDKKQEDYIYKVDYKSYQTFENYISIVFENKTFNADDKLINTNYHSINYNLKDKQTLGLIDVFRSDYKIQLKIQDNTSFVILEDGIQLNEQKEKRLIKYEDNKKFIGLQDKKIPSLFQSERVKPAPPQKIDPDKPMIAFTFDDGPNTAFSNQIMDAFKKVDGRATFFMLGNRVGGESDTIKRMVEEGHQLGNHSFNHLNLAKQSNDVIHSQFFDTQDLIYAACGYESTAFRPPYGEESQSMKDMIPYDMTMWNVDSIDWKHKKDKEAIKKEVLPFVKDGSVILLHDIYKTSADAIDDLLPELKKAGYQFVSIDDLKKYRPK